MKSAALFLGGLVTGAAFIVLFGESECCKIVAREAASRAASGLEALREKVLGGGTV